MCNRFIEDFTKKVVEEAEKLQETKKYLYIVTREWCYDLIKMIQHGIIFISLDKQKAKQYMLKNKEYEILYLCKIAIDEELEIISWEKYVINTSNDISIEE